MGRKRLVRRDLIKDNVAGRSHRFTLRGKEYDIFVRLRKKTKELDDIVRSWSAPCRPIGYRSATSSS
jgi:hypothetical protein